MKLHSAFILSTALAASPAFAQAPNSQSQQLQTQSFFDVMPAGAGLLSNIVIDSQVTTARVGSYTRLNMHLGCYATNLRSVGNPVSGNSIVTAIIDVYNASGTLQTILVEFPAEFLKPVAVRDMAVANNVTLTKSLNPYVKMKAFDNIVQLLMPNIKEMTITSDGEVTNVTEKNLIVAGIRFSQKGAPGAPYTGHNGPLSSSISWYTSIDGKTIDVYANFPGAANPGQRARYQGETRTGFCGGYYSPLMLFFDDSTPQFSATSKFSLSKEQPGSIFWPEAGSPGYFLVLDEKGDGKILDGSQLFGDTEKFKDGFENLASHDTNKDGVIDANDKVFKHLKLWNDRNSDGVSQKVELKTLKEMGVTSIDLKFEYETKKFGDRAEYKQKSSFNFKKNQATKKGRVLDLWFSPAP